MSNWIHFPPHYFDKEAHVKVDVNPEVNVAEVGLWAGDRMYFRFPMQEASLVYEMESPFNLHTCHLENAVVTAVFPLTKGYRGVVTLMATIKRAEEPDRSFDEVLAEWE